MSYLISMFRPPFLFDEMIINNFHHSDRFPASLDADMDFSGHFFVFLG